MFPIVPGREDTNQAMASATAIGVDFDDCVANGIPAYSFLSVLTPLDRLRFIAALDPIERVKVYSRRSISLCKWAEVLGRTKLQRIYMLYRHSYVGESAKKPPSNMKTNEMSLLHVESGIREDPTSIPTYEKVLIVVRNNHLRVVEKIVKCEYSNKEYFPDDSELELL